MRSRAFAAPFTADQAKAHDGELAEATRALYRAQMRRRGAIDSTHRAAGDRSGGARRGVGQTWQMSDAEAYARTAAIAAAAGPQSSSAQRALDALAGADRDITHHNTEIERLEQIWCERGRWTRFFVVNGGHIHRSTACRTLRPTTRVGWLPALSGETEADAVAAHGAVLCTVCFPSAPVEWTTKASAPQVCAGTGAVP